MSLLVLFACSTTNAATGAHLETVDADTVDWKAKELPYWKEVLSEEQVRVCRQAGTERPWSSPMNDAHGEGSFVCSSCGQALFDADAKFDSGTGWPSFHSPIDAKAVTELSDVSFGMIRTEVRCSRCDAHLGHVFDDGPKPTGKRYCINGVCLLKEPK